MYTKLADMPGNKGDSMRKLLMTTVFGLTLPAVALAQGGGATSAQGIEEIVVTAQKREQNLQDVGISVAAITGDSLKDMGISRSIDIEQRMPGVTITENGGPNITVANIRGVGGVSASGFNEASVAFYQDQVLIPVVSYQSAAIFDVDRVEVLRGPQGTLFGRNTTGGVIHYLSRKPSKETDGFIEAGYGTDGEYRVEGAVGGALGEKIQGRVSLLGSGLGDYISNRAGPKLGGGDTQAGRLQLSFQPGEGVNVNLLAGYSKLDYTFAYQNQAAAFDADGLMIPLAPTVDFYGAGRGNDSGGYRDRDGDPYATAQNKPSRNDIKKWNSQAIIDWNLGFADLTSVTAYVDGTNKYFEEADASPLPGLDFYNPNDSRWFTQELRLAGGDDRLRWITGAYYIDRRTETANSSLTFNGGYANNYLFFGPFLAPNDVWRTVSSGALTNEGYALFGQVEYNVNDMVGMVAGLRWSQDTFKFNWLRREFINGVATGGAARFGILPDENFRGTKRESDWSGKIQLNVKPNSDTLVYASLSRGTKTGGFNNPFLASPVSTFKPEELMAYELGVKADLMDRRVRWNSAVYYYDYPEYQTFRFSNAAASLENVKSTVKGFETELTALLGEGFQAGVGIGYIDGKLSRVNIAQGGPPVFRGRVNPLSPKWKWSLLLRKDWTLGDGATLYAQGDVAHTDRYEGDVVNNPAARGDARTIGNLTLGYRSANDSWGLTVVGRNITDEKYVSLAFPLFTTATQQYGQRRSVMATASYRF